MAKKAAAGPVEGPWALPEGWHWERLGDVCEPSQYGWTTKASSSGHTKFLRTTDISSGRVDWATVPYCTEAPFDLERYRIKAGDILISRAGSVGKSFLIDSADDAVFASYLIRFRPLSVPRYIHLWLQTETYWSMITKNTAGIAIPNVNASKLSDLPVPMAPAHIRARAVARIDELFAEIDDGEAALARARNDLATWRKALLKAAVTGELTADWRAANPAAETGADLLGRILADRLASWEAKSSNKGKRYKEPRPVAIDDGRELPEGWTWASVDQIGEIVTGNTPPASDLAAYDGDVPFFTPGDLDAGFALDATKRTLGPSGLAKSRPVPPRSILVTCIGATIGKVGFNSRAGATNQQINTIIPVVDDLAECIFHYFDGPGQHLVINGASSTTMPIINKRDFSRLPVPMPPLEEAREISRVIVARYTDADAARDYLRAARLAAAALRQSILAAAFRGELV